MSGASFTYPLDGNFSAVALAGDVNYFDTLEVSYTSDWDALNLTLFCLIGDSTTDYGVWQAPGNPLASSGTLRLASIASAGFTIVQFPAPCSFKLTQYGNNDIATGGDNFEVVSQPGTSTTYSSTATPLSTHSSSSIASQTASTTQTSASENTSTSSGIQSASLSSSSTSTTSTTISQPVAQETGLSTGAKAGIGIGIAVVVLVILALCFFIFRLRRKASIKPVQEDLISFQDGPPAYPPSGDEKALPASNDLHELEQTSRIELPIRPIQQRRIGPTELA